MRRSACFRVILGLWGLWFTTALSASIALRACPEHHAQGSASHAPAHGAQPHAAHGQTETSSQQPLGHPGNQRVCLGLCCCSPAAKPAIVVRLVDWSPAHAKGVGLNEARAPEFHWAHAHPFANGPPIAL